MTGSDLSHVPLLPQRVGGPPNFWLVREDEVQAAQNGVDPVMDHS